MYPKKLMNTLRPGWIDEQSKLARQIRNQGLRNSQPIVHILPEFETLFSSSVFPVSRSVFTSRLRRF